MNRFKLWITLTVTAPAVMYLATGCTFSAPGAGPVPPAESNPNSYMCACDCGPEPRTRMLRIAGGQEDAEELISDGAIDRASLDLDLINIRLMALRFRNLGIPAGSTIQSAHIQFASTADDVGEITTAIHGEKAVASAPISLVARDITNRVRTTASVSWPVPGWLTGAAGAEQLSPDLTQIVQEVIDQPGWATSNPISFIFSHVSGAGRRHGYSYNNRIDLAPQLIVTYVDGNAPTASHMLNTCMVPEHNVNIGGAAPDMDALAADCSGRVQDTLTGLAGACGYPPVCTCSVVPASTRYAASCDESCAEVAVDAECTNFDPEAGNTTATNAAGDEPVCLATAAPMANALFGQRTMCDVSGEVVIDIEDETVSPAAAGIVNFVGFCPNGNCGVGLEYLLDLDDVTVSNFWGSATFVDLASIGKSLPGEEAQLSAAGEGTFGPDSTDSSSRGRRGSEQKAFVSTNDDVIDVAATFGASSPTCAVAGAFIGSSDPERSRCEGFGPSADIICTSGDECEDVPECSDEVCDCEPVTEDSEMAMQMFLEGTIINQPPTASATDQTVECNQSNSSLLTLDGSASSDFENNISLYSWRLGDRMGAEVGFEEKSELEQGVGTQTYVLRVIDSYGQADETTSEITVEDTTPPVISCNNDPTVTPPQIPARFTATATDVCDPDLEPEITAYDCFAYTSKGAKIDKTSSCKVTFDGDTVTIAHSGGVGTIITWDVEVTDAGGNTTEKTCQVLAVRK